MRELHLEKREIDFNDYIKRTALSTDASTLIKDDVIIYHNGQPVLLYVKLDGDKTKHLRWAVKNIDYLQGKRTLGLISQSRVFGYNPRNPRRQDYCRSAEIAKEAPKQHFTIANFAENLHQIYNQYFPEIYQKHMEMVNERVLPEWRIGDTPFTSGIVNKDNPLKYHLDAGNFRGVLSNMVAFKKGVEGGFLVVPEFDISLEIADNSLTIFNGQEILHGVSPFEKTQKDGYRYTVVYYSLEQMWKCETITEELARIRNTVKEKEKKRRDPEHQEALRKEAQKMRERIQKRQHKKDESHETK